MAEQPPSSPNRLPQEGYKPKCLMGIPWRFAFAMIDDGWILRNDIIWHKPNHMPSSVKDRLSNAYEHIFHFVRQQKYYYDLDAIREPHKGHPSGNIKRKTRDKKLLKGNLGSSIPWIPTNKGKNLGDVIDSKSKYVRTELESNYVGTGRNPNIKLMKELGMVRSERSTALGMNLFGRNPGDFWSIPTEPFKDAHFAVFPEAICERPIKSSCPEGGVVLDPMCGSGTACLVARNLKRDFVGIELNPSYVEIAKKRLGLGSMSLKGLIPE